jgi:small subunit ribosomal protein S29
VGSYYPLQKALVPEAFQPFYQAFYAPRPPGSERRGGCKGLQAELALSKRPYIMYRECMHRLAQAVRGAPGSRLVLQGAQGAGKSLALVGLVEWARANGW